VIRSTRRTAAAVALLALFAAFGCARRTQTTTTPEAFPPVAAPAPRAPAPEPTPAPIVAAPAPRPAERRSRLDTIYFEFDRSELRRDARATLETNAQYLRANPGARVQIEGHCDERGSVQYNLALGERRAESAREYLESLGVSPGRMSTISYGEERPVDRGQSEEAWAKNRRAEFRVLN
jgi:peptidoglycan-associated lipoprotein